MANVVQIVIRGIDQTKKGFDGALSNMEGFKKAAATMTTAAVGAGVAVAGTLTALTVHAIDTADEMGKMSERTQIPVEMLSRLAYAARLAGLENAGLEDGLKNLNKTMAEAAGGMKSKATEALEAIGVSVLDTNGKLKSNQQVLMEAAEKFAGYKDGANKAALALAIFGDQGARMLPLLNQGANGIKNSMGDAATVTEEAAKQAQVFNDNITALKEMAKEMGVTIATELLPHLVEFSNWMVKTTRENGIFVGVAMTAVDVVKKLALSIFELYTKLEIQKILIAELATIAREFFVGILGGGIDVLKGVVTTLKAVDDGIVALASTAGDAAKILSEFFTGNFSESLASSKEMIAKMQANLANTGQEIVKIWEQSGKGISGNIEAAYARMKAAGAKASADIKKELTDLVQFQQALYGKKPEEQPKADTRADAPVVVNTDAIKKEIAEREKGFQKLTELYADMYAASLTGARKEQFEIDLNYKKRLEQIESLAVTQEEKNLAAEAALKERNDRMAAMQVEHAQQVSDLEAQLTIEGADEWEQRTLSADAYYQKRLQQIMELATTETEMNRMLGLLEKARLAQEKAINTERLNAVKGMLGNMTTASMAFGKKGFEAAKAFQIAQTTMDTYASATAAYRAMVGVPFIGPALAVAAAAAAIAAGMANVAKISSTSYSGQAHDGLEYVPSTGTYILEQGERVIKRNQNERLEDFLDEGGNGNSAGQRSIIVPLYLDGQMIAKAIKRMSGDGRLEIFESAII